MPQSTVIVRQSTPAAVLCPPEWAAQFTQRQRGTPHRVGMHAQWLWDTGRHWWEPALAEWRDHLLRRLAPVSVRSYLSTVRTRYEDLLGEQATYDLVLEGVRQEQPEASLADLYTLADAVVERIRRALVAPVKVQKVMDRLDGENGTRLTLEQVQDLLERPGQGDLLALRDAAVLALAVSTGARLMEVSQVTVAHLNAAMNGERGLNIPYGKGAKRRFVPFGDFAVFIDGYVGRWMSAAGIEDGYVIRSTRSLANQQVSDHLLSVIPGNYWPGLGMHDLRRTYARILYEAGVDVDYIRMNMGHNNQQETWRYIGPVNATWRAPKLSL